MHKLWQHPNGTWYVLHGPRLRSRTSTGSKDRKRAEARLAQFIAAADSAPVEQPTVGEILNGYVADRLSTVRSPETLRFNATRLNSDLGQLLPAQLLPAVIRRYAAERGASAGTILREIGVLRAALAWGVEHQWIATQPIISNPVKTPKAKDRWLTKEEAQRLLNACQPIHLKAFVILGLTTAARTSAILEATWDRVDLDAGRIDYGPGHGNKRRAVAIPLNGEALAVLKALRELACTPYVIEYHGRPAKAIRKGFRAACRRAGLTGVSPHTLRHTAATWAVIAGTPLSEVARLLGDREETVERVYGHHSPDYLKRATGALQIGRNENKSALQV